MSKGIFSPLACDGTVAEGCEDGEDLGLGGAPNADIAAPRPDPPNMNPPVVEIPGVTGSFHRK